MLYFHYFFSGIISLAKQFTDQDRSFLSFRAVQRLWIDCCCHIPISEGVKKSIFSQQVHSRNRPCLEKYCDCARVCMCLGSCLIFLTPYSYIVIDIWGGRGSFSNNELKAGERYIAILKKTQIRWTLLPVGVIGFQLARRFFMKTPKDVV